MTVTKKPDHRGEHEISRKTIARGMPGVSGVTVVTNARVYYSTRAAAGAPGARHSLRPLFGEGGTSRAKLGRIAPRECEGVFQLRACAISSLEGEGRCEAAGWGDLSTRGLFGMRDRHPTPSHISLRSCELTLPLQGRVSGSSHSVSSFARRDDTEVPPTATEPRAKFEISRYPPRGQNARVVCIMRNNWEG
jgi:hypothetical protein